MQFGKLNAQVKKNQIFKATFQCIYEEGFVGMSTRSIAKKANVHQATIHYYFKSKENLLGEFMEALFDQLIDDIRRRYIAEDSPEKKFEAILASGKHFATKEKEKFVVFMSCWSLCVRDQSMKKLLTKVYQRFIKALEEILEEGIKAGVFNNVKTESMSLHILSFVQGLSLFMWAMPVRSFKAEEHFDEFASQLRRIVRREEN